MGNGEAIGRLLVARGETVAVCETSAGGLLSAALLAEPGASAWYAGGVIAYTPHAKVTWLSLTPEVFAETGTVSEPAARALAEAACAALGVTWGVAETGIAGPQTGRRSSKPAGLAYVAVAGPVSLVRRVETGAGDRVANQLAFATAALSLLHEALERAPGMPPRR